MNDSNRSTKHDELRLLSGNAPSVLYCQQGNPSILPEPKQLRNHANYEWADVLGVIWNGIYAQFATH
jgi:hypothetical protein